MSHRELMQKILSGSADPQAVLFYGPDSDQMDDLAAELAASRLPAEVSALARHVDFQKIVPQGAGRIIKKNTIMPIKDNDDEEPFEGIPAVEFFRTRPLMGQRKVMWFRGADRFGPKAANSFLKTLEELSASSRVILTSTEFARVLPTIRSRCLCVGVGHEGWSESAPESLMEMLWARSDGELVRLRKYPDIFDAFWEAMELIHSAPRMGAVMISERVHGLAGEYSKLVGVGVRDAQVEFLELIGRWWLGKYPEYPDVAADCSAVAREISGYSNGQLGFDTLFGTMLAHIREPVVMGGRY